MFKKEKAVHDKSKFNFKPNSKGFCVYSISVGLIDERKRVELSS